MPRGKPRLLWQGDVRLSAELGGTWCPVSVWSGSGDVPPVAVVVETTANDGVSVELVFPLIVQEVLGRLAAPTPELFWVLRSEARAIASVLVGQHRVSRDNLMLFDGASWVRMPIAGAVTRYLTDSSDAHASAPWSQLASLSSDHLPFAAPEPRGRTNEGSAGPPPRRPRLPVLALQHVLAGAVFLLVAAASTALLGRLLASVPGGLLALFAVSAVLLPHAG